MGEKRDGNYANKCSVALYCYCQSDREKAEGLPVAPFMDRDKVTKATAQIGFIKFVLMPLFESLSKVSTLRLIIDRSHVIFSPSR